MTIKNKEVNKRVINEVLNDFTISFSDDKKVVSFEGKCPVCNKGIVFSVENDMRKRWNQIAGQIYEWFLLNNEVCIECRQRFEAWCKAHKEFCTAHKIGPNDVANKFLEKLGKPPCIGTNSSEEEAEEQGEPNSKLVTPRVRPLLPQEVIE